MLEKFHDTLNAIDDILIFNEDFSKITFFVNQMGILGVDLDRINLDNDDNFDEYDPDTIVHVRLLAWHSKFEEHKAPKKDLRINACSVASNKMVGLVLVRR